MRTGFISVACAAAFILTAQTANADDKKDFLVGKWEMNTTMNGYIERGVMTLRADSTGHLERSALGQPTMNDDFTWRLEKGGIRFSYGPQDVKHARLRIDDFKHITLKPANAQYRVIGPDMEFERKDPEDEITAEKPFTIVGLWLSIETRNGTYISHTMQLNADGTGEETIYYSNIFGWRREEVRIRWNYANDTITRVSPTGEYAFARVGVIDRRHVTILHVGGFPVMNGGRFEYTLQEDQGEEGCWLEDSRADHRIVRNEKKNPDGTPVFRKKRRSSFPV